MNTVTRRHFLRASGTRPVIHDGRVVFTKQIDPPEPDGNLGHTFYSLGSQLMKVCLFLVLITLPCLVSAADWPCIFGPNGTGYVSDQAPTTWSVVNKNNIIWQKKIPETGQSSVAVVGSKLFYTHYKPVTGDVELGQDIVAVCADAATGAVLWQRPMNGKNPWRLSGCFGDSTSPTPVSDGKHVVFWSASGIIACFTMDGKPVWQLESTTDARPQPYLFGKNIIYTKQNFPTSKSGTIKSKETDVPLSQWTQLQALDIATGAVVWTTTCGTSQSAVTMPQAYGDNKVGIVVGRGGGHTDFEKPRGVSLIDPQTGAALWSVEIPDFASTLTYHIRHNQVLLIQGPEHFWLDAATGAITKRINFVENASVCAWNGKAYQQQPVKNFGFKDRFITQESNFCVGDYHFFRTYKQPYLGRINIVTGAVEFLQLPVQLIRVVGQPDKSIWTLKEATPMTVKNVNGFVVMGDDRSSTNTWGHAASPLMTAMGDHLYIPTMNGTVYVIQWNAEKLDEHAIVAVNDLGAAGATWTRASITGSHGRLYARTLTDLICIGQP